MKFFVSIDSSYSYYIYPIYFEFFNGMNSYPRYLQCIVLIVRIGWIATVSSGLCGLSPYPGQMESAFPPLHLTLSICEQQQQKKSSRVPEGYPRNENMILLQSIPCKYKKLSGSIQFLLSTIILAVFCIDDEFEQASLLGTKNS